jgi:hypothetical protein
MAFTYTDALGLVLMNNNAGGFISFAAGGTAETQRMTATTFTSPTVTGTTAVMIGTKARLVPIVGPPGGVQLQVLNNSAVWENVDSWVAST